mmetsp:Transcript_69/g.203  ORF Transcript_69/g.203 Transcript_69/m.203 type:complete len:212 (-) Transcript_69:379-1014(-)
MSELSRPAPTVVTSSCGTERRGSPPVSSRLTVKSSTASFHTLLYQSLLPVASTLNQRCLVCQPTARRRDCQRRKHEQSLRTMSSRSNTRGLLSDALLKRQQQCRIVRPCACLWEQCRPKLSANCSALSHTLGWATRAAAAMTSQTTLGTATTAQTTMTRTNSTRLAHHKPPSLMRKKWPTLRVHLLGRGSTETSCSLPGRRRKRWACTKRP